MASPYTVHIAQSMREIAMGLEAPDRTFDPRAETSLYGSP
jgi:hypothetical protein